MRHSLKVAFLADHPRIRVDHCHNLKHASDRLIADPAHADVTTPYRVGSSTRQGVYRYMPVGAAGFGTVTGSAPVLSAYSSASVAPSGPTPRDVPSQATASA